MDILLLGNGFDLSFGLPTRYTDFVKVVQCLIDNEQSIPTKVAEILKPLGIDYEYAKDALLDADAVRRMIDLSKTNIWFDYFKNKINVENSTWIDFERELSYINHLFNIVMSKDGVISFKIDSKHRDLDQETLYAINNFYGHFFIERQRNCGESLSFRFKDDFYIEYPPQSKNKVLDRNKVVSRLHSALEELSDCLRIYLLSFVDNPIRNNPNWMGNCKVKYNRVDLVLTFNYTNTYESIVDYEINTFHLHGNVNEKIVLGYNPDADDYTVPAETTWLEFKKYYQRAFIDVNQILIRFKQIVKSERGGNELFVMGFSLSSSDEDIIRLIFEQMSKITIYCHSEDAKKEYIRNLIQIYGKAEYDNLVYNKQLTFLTGYDQLISYFNRTRLADIL